MPLFRGASHGTRPTRCPVTTPPATLPAPPSLVTLTIAGPAIQATARRAGGVMVHDGAPDAQLGRDRQLVQLEHRERGGERALREPLAGGGSSASSNTRSRAPTHTPHHRQTSTAHAPDTRRAQLKRLHHPPEACVWGCGKPACRNRWRVREEPRASRVEPRNLGALAYPTLRRNRGRTHYIRHEATPGASAPIGSHQRRR